MKKVLILDYQLGNLFSVNQACKKVKIDSFVSSNWKDIKKCDAIILPGVGSFARAMKNIKSLDLVKPLEEFVIKEKPLFGICLGMQLLFGRSEEFKSTKGLGYLKGTIKKFDNKKLTSMRVKVPQIGWNTIHSVDSRSWKNSPLKNLKNNDYMYFIHSFYANPNNKSEIISFTDYDNFKFASSVSNNKNIFATQFHPEKSGVLGIEIYRNWAKLNDLL